MSLNSKVVLYFSITIFAIAFIAYMPAFGLSATLQGMFFYSLDQVTQVFLNANKETLLMFRYLELIDLFILIPLYTYIIFQLLDLVMHNFKISPFKAFAFMPAAFDVPETLLLIINNIFFAKQPFLINMLPTLSFFKWVSGGLVVIILFIFSLAKVKGVTGTIKIISYEQLWSNPKNVKHYWGWLAGNVLIAVVSIIFVLYSMLGLQKVPSIQLSFLVIAFIISLIENIFFNLIVKFPRHIFSPDYKNSLKTVFITLNTIFLMFALGLGMNKTLRVGTTGDYAPFSYLEEGKRVGIDIELAKNLGADLGYKIQFVQTSWLTLMEDFKSSKYDIALSGITDTDKRRETVSFSESYYKNGKTAITRCEDKEKYKTLSAIDNPSVKVIYNPGGTNEKYAKENLKNAQHIVYQDNSTIFNEIILKKADVMVTDIIEVLYQANKQPELCMALGGELLTQSQIAILLPLDTQLKSKIDNWLIEYKSSGTLENLIQKYLK